MEILSDWPRTVSDLPEPRRFSSPSRWKVFPEGFDQWIVGACWCMACAYARRSDPLSGCAMASDFQSMYMRPESREFRADLRSGCRPAQGLTSCR